MKKVILAILDGVGVKDSLYGNAFKQSNTKTIDFLLNKYPHSLLKASGESVGLPKGQMGNSEVGHMTIGTGRVTYQPLLKINWAISNKEFFKNEQLLDVMSHVNKNDSKLHILGLLSDGGVHSSIDHIFSLIKMAKENGIKKLYIHVFLDGRDTAYNSALKYLDELDLYLKEINLGIIGTISGRYYAMDREEFYDRIKLSYDVIVNNYGPYEPDYRKLITESYEKEEYDEFVKPTIINKGGVIESDDGLILANFRPDRVSELFEAITNPNFDKFQTRKLENIKLVTMTDVSDKIICNVAFKNELITNTLGEVLDQNNYKTLRIAEVSKFPHVTHFFDGDRDLNLNNTTKIKIPKKDVATYDLYPKMSAEEVTKKIVGQIKNYDFIIVNYANGDMVGHTGNFKAATEAMEEIDHSIKKLYNLSLANNFLLIITADHGNLEEMLDEHGQILTTHTTNPVYFIVCDEHYNVKNGSLSNIAPSILSILNLPIPKEMDKNIIIEEIL